VMTRPVRPTDQPSAWEDGDAVLGGGEGGGGGEVPTLLRSKRGERLTTIARAWLHMGR